MHPGDGRVVSNFIVQALQGRPLSLYGEGQQTRSFCYVDDLVTALIGLMETGDEVTGPINLGNPDEFTIRQLAEAVLALTGSRSALEYHPLPQDDPRQRQPDITLAQTTLGWTPSTDLQWSQLRGARSSATWPGASQLRPLQGAPVEIRNGQGISGRISLNGGQVRRLIHRRKSDPQPEAVGNADFFLRILDLAMTLRELHEKRQLGDIPAFDHVIIETSGLADPVPILHTMMANPMMQKHYAPDAVVTCVDQINLERTLQDDAVALSQ
eukprot:gene5515-7489_t